MKWRGAAEHWQGASYTPRRWQSTCLPIAIAELDAGDPGVVQAVMGSGKSVLIAELVRSALLKKGERVIITTPSQRLVDQLAATLAERLGLSQVGRYFAKAKNIHAPVIVACYASVGKLAKALAGWGGRRCALWIADEVHRTECALIKGAYKALAPDKAIGFTATPWRGARTEELSLWKRLIYRYGPTEALDDGVVVPWKIVPWTGPKQALDTVCLEMIRSAEGAGVVSSSSIKDAELFAKQLSSAGIPAAAIHSKLPKGRDGELLTMLERGLLKCVVHVSLLQEGVNLPWLRWICLRRPVSSSVRFSQEVGRVLRASPGKERAIIYDPHDLFSEHRLTQEAVLQGMADEPKEAVKKPIQKMVRGEITPLQERTVEGMKPTEAYLRTLVVALDECGIIDSRGPSGAWRHEPVTTRQIAAIEKHAWLLRVVRNMPPAHRSMLRQVYQHRRGLRKGSASDFLDVIFNLPTTGWPRQASQLVGLH